MAAWKRISDFIHRQSKSKFCLQLSHSGRKGSTRRGWEGMDRPLPDGNWEVVAASPLAFHEFMHVPREINRGNKERVIEDYARAAVNTEKAGFDMIELHASHGYLLSGFISSLSNERKDEYGGCLENRMRFPLEVFDVVRPNWPNHRPMSVRISATDWAPRRRDRGGGTADRRHVSAARDGHHRRVSGADLALGQSCLRPHIPNSVFGNDSQRGGVPTLAVGNITTADQINTIIAAERADLCALARPHLVNPHFTLVASAEYAYDEQYWPMPYLSGKDQAFRLYQRQQAEMRTLR